MNTSVSPLPIRVWPLLGLSLALISVTTAAVTFSSQRATQQMREQAQAQAQPSLEVEAPVWVPRPSLRETAQRRTVRNAQSNAT